jgi:CheY-like chemotaxis protein
VVNLEREALGAKDLDLWFEVAEDLPKEILGDPARLRQVLLNLLSNAIKFTAEGSVKIHLGVQRPSSNEVYLHCQVQDTGIGISQEVLSKLFAPFYQADSSTRRQFGGTGLGLAISRRIIEAMGGEIGCESTPQQGSTFWFIVPLNLPTSSSPHSPHPTTLFPPRTTGLSPQAARGCRLLLVEDNPINQLVTLEQLKNLGYKTHAVDSGQQALETLAKQSYDLVLMDCQMPGLDGYETTRLIRQRENRAEHIPIIAVTAHALPEDREKCLEAGMDDFLSKPYTEEALAMMVSRWLPTKNPTVTWGVSPVLQHFYPSGAM